MNSIRAIILCGGISNRWNNYLNVEKHFVNVNGISIVENTLKLLKHYDLDICIVTNEKNQFFFLKFNYPLIVINSKQATLEFYKIKATYDSWNTIGKTILLMGDVWYTKKALKKIITSTEKKLLFFGRQRKNFFTKCKHGELFAISFYQNNFTTIKFACEKLEFYITQKHIEISGGWGIYDIVSNLEFLIKENKIIKGYALFSNFCHITDITDDIDTPKDYENLVLALKYNRIFLLLLSVKSFIFYSLLKIFNIIFEFFYSNARTTHKDNF